MKHRWLAFIGTGRRDIFIVACVKTFFCPISTLFALFGEWDECFYFASMKMIVDVLLVVGLFAAAACSKLTGCYDYYWQSPHCIAGFVWFLLVILHVWQNLRFIKAFKRRKFILKNKITFLTLIIFVLMFFSILAFVGNIGTHLMHFHHIIGRLFGLVILIHFVDKFKKFTAFFRRPVKKVC